MHRDVTVIGASAGSIAPLRQLLSELPPDYPAAVFIVVHLAPEAPTILHTVLNRVSNMPVGLARSGARICMGPSPSRAPTCTCCSKGTGSSREIGGAGSE